MIDIFDKVKQGSSEAKKRFFKMIEYLMDKRKIIYLIQIDEKGKEKRVPPKYLLNHGFSMDEVLDIMQMISKNDRRGLQTIINIKTKQVTILNRETSFDYSTNKKKHK